MEPSSLTVTSARPSAEAPSLPSDESLKKDIPISAKNLTADEAEEPISTVVKTEAVKVEIESKLLNLPTRFNIKKSDEDRKRKFPLGYVAGAKVSKGSKLQKARVMGTCARFLHAHPISILLPSFLA